MVGELLLALILGAAVFVAFEREFGWRKSLGIAVVVAVIGMWLLNSPGSSKGVDGPNCYMDGPGAVDCE